MSDSNSNEAGKWEWRLSAHPITLLVFLGFRLSSLLTYLFGLLFTSNYVLIFILTILLLSADFYNLKNIAGRRLVGLRWWNEVDPTSSTGESHMVYESLDPNDENVTGRKVTAVDRRFFWAALYAQPVLWVVLAIVAVVRLEFIWLTLVVVALILTITNLVAFSRCDKFSQANNLASSALLGSGLARGIAGNIAGGMVSRLFGGR